MMNPAQAQVFVSYAWGGESERLVDEIERSLAKCRIDIYRDKSRLPYGGSIKQFMKKIGAGHAVIVVVSRKYLRSENCMFELLEIEKHGDIRDRIFPIVLPDAGIYEALERVDYVRFWEQKKHSLEERVRALDGLEHIGGAARDLDLYDDIRDSISSLADTLKDMNALTVDLHRESGFSELAEALTLRIEEVIGRSTHPPSSGQPRTDPMVRAAESRGVSLWRQRLPLVNLGVLITIVISSHLWSYLYTESLLKGLVAEAGLATGVILLAKLLSEPLKARLLRDPLERVLISGRTTLVLFLFLTMLCTWTLTRGTLILKTSGDEASLGQVTIHRMKTVDEWESRPILKDFLQADDERVFLLRSAIANRIRYRVKVGGLPASVISISPLGRTTLLVPSSFKRTVLLLRPNFSLYNTAETLAEKSKPLRLEVSMQEKVIAVHDPYLGQAVLVGGDQDISISEDRRSAWQKEGETYGYPDWMEEWWPADIKAPDLILKEGDTLEIHCRTHNGNPYGAFEVTIRGTTTGSADVLQEVVLDVP